MTFLEYCQNLKPEDWGVRINDSWTVKDLVAHMVGWEKGFIEIIEALVNHRDRPWFMSEDQWSRYNEKSVREYKEHGPSELLLEWEKWQKELKETTVRFGESNLRKYPELVEWVFDTSENSHYNHHLRQIKEVLEKHP